MDIAYKMNFGDNVNMNRRISRAREAKGLSQEALGALIGVAQATISKWENGQREPGIGNAMKLAEVLGCPMEKLMKKGDGGAREPESTPDPLPHLPPDSALDTLLETAFEAAGIHPAEARFLVQSLREYAARFESQRHAPESERRMKELVRALVAAVALRQRG